MRQGPDEYPTEENHRIKPLVAGQTNLFVLATVLGIALVALIFDRLMPPIGLAESLWVRGVLLTPVFLMSMWFLLSHQVKGARIPIVLLGCAVLFGLALRLHAFFMLQDTVLEPDAQIYRAKAMGRSLGHFWDANTWTPFHVYLIRIWYFLFGTSEPTQRSLTVVLSLIVVLVTFALGQRLFSRLAATSASMMVALSPTLLVSAARGLREEIVILEVLLFLWVLLRPTKNLWTAAALGVLLGLVALTRMELLLPLSFSLLVVSLRSRSFDALRLVMTGTLVMILVVPQGLLLQKTHGDVFHWTGVFTRVFINIEYRTGNLSDDAFERSADRPELLPSLSDIRRNTFEGPPTSPATWFFRVHDAQTFIERTLVGAALIPLSATQSAVFPRSEVTRSGSGKLPPFISVVARVIAILVTVLATAGIALTVRKHRPETVLVLLAASAMYAFPFTIGVITLTPKPQVFDIRVVEFLMPIMLVGAGGALQLFVRRGALQSLPITPLNPPKVRTE